MIKLFDNKITFLHSDLSIFIPVIAGIIGFIVYWFIQDSDRIKNSFVIKYGEDNGSAKFIMFTKYLGGISIGLFPAILYLIAFPESSFSQLGFAFNSKTFSTSILWIVILALIIIPFTSFSARKPKHLLHYPQIRAKIWNRRMILGNLVAWAFYLLGYEFFFRGILLFPLVEKIGLWPAIAINIGLYSSVHIPKGLNETIGAIPLSILLCLLTVQTGTIWIAFFVHVTMAWTNSLTALKFNPDMKIVK